MKGQPLWNLIKAGRLDPPQARAEPPGHAPTLLRRYGAPRSRRFARSGDTLIVWKLDRLARSMKQLIEMVETLRARGIGFRGLTDALDTTTAQR
jgi:hypothetical protein